MSNEYSIFDKQIGLDAWLQKGVTEISTNSPEKDNSASSVPGVSNQISNSPSLNSITGGESGVILSYAKKSFTDTVEGWFQGMDTDGTYKWLIGGSSSSIDWNVTTANTLTIIGSITATTGAFGGFEIGSDYIRDAANSFGLASAISTTPAADSIELTARTVSLNGTTGLTMIVNATLDDANILVTLPFPVTFNGIAYTNVYVGSNGYLTFGTGSSAFSGLSASNPAIPGIHINARDGSYQRVYKGSLDGNATYIIRYEGALGTSGTPGSSTVFWEIKFTAATPDIFLIDIGSNAASATGTSGITNGSAYIKTFGSGYVNQGYTLDFSYPNPAVAIDDVRFWAGAAYADRASAATWIKESGAAKFSNITLTGLQAGSSVDGQYLASLSVTAASIANATITGGKIATGTITATNITAATITANEIANATITGAKIASATISGSNIASATISGSNIASGTITGTNISSATITSSNIASATITGSNIASGTITGTNIGSATITGSNIASATIAGSNISLATISASNIVSGTITTTQIASGTITGGNIASATITGSNIAGTTITATNITALTITAAEIANLTINGAKISSGAITPIKTTMPLFMVSAGTFTNNSPVAGSVAWSSVTIQFNGTEYAITNNNTAARYIVWDSTSPTAISGSATVPTVATTWLLGMNNSGTFLKTWDMPQVHGEQIQSATITGGQIAAATITATNIQAATITATQIATGTITGTQIAAATISGSNIASGTITGSNIASATITGANIGSATITSANIANATITTTQISGTAGITGSQLANNTITATQITNATITTSQIASSTITGSNIANNTITASNIANATITATQIANATITATEIANLTIVAGNIANATITATKLTISQLSAITADMGSITAGTIVLASTGYVRSGQTDYNTGTGFFLGRSGGATKFSIGDTTTGNSLTWDATTLLVNGSTISNGDIYGDGSDGDVTISANTTLTRDMFYNNLTISAGFSLNTGGFRVFVKGTCTIQATASFHRNGNDASGQTGGAALANGSLQGALAGINGSSGGAAKVLTGAFQKVNGDAGSVGSAGVGIAKSLVTLDGVSLASKTSGSGGNTNAVPGTGGAGQIGAAGGVRTGTIYNQIRTAMAAYNLFDIYPESGGNPVVAAFKTAPSNGGAPGGGSGACVADYTTTTSGYGGYGGGGGGQAGIVSLFARILINNGTISADGGDAANGQNGGPASLTDPTGNHYAAAGGGGGGCGGCGGNAGVVICVYGSKSGSGTITAAGGAKGTKGLKSTGVAYSYTATDGTDGQDGTDGNAGTVIELVV